MAITTCFLAYHIDPVASTPSTSPLGSYIAYPIVLSTRAYRVRRDCFVHTYPLSTSMSQRQVCKYYNSPSGCTRANCFFQHVRENQRMGGGGVRSFEDVPRDVCSFYWRTGKCKRGFDCRFKHESRLRVHDSSILTAAEGPTSTSASAQNAQSAMDRVAPYLTNSGLAKIHGFKTDIFFADVDAKNLGPNQTHYYLRAFLADHFRLNTTTQMYRFLSLLNSASTENNSWVCLSSISVIMLYDSFKYDRNWKMAR